MARVIAVFAGIGLGLLSYDVVHFPWSPHSFFSTDLLFGNSLANGGLFLLVLLFFRIGVLCLLVKEAYQALQWRYYRGKELRSQWMHDFSPDSN